MKTKRLRKINLMRAAMTLALIMTCATAWAQTTQSVTYIDENGQTQTVDAEQFPSNRRLYSDTWYYVSGTVGSDSDILYLMQQNGTHNLILCDGATLTIKCIQQSSQKFASLRVYGQSGGTGKLNVGTGNVVNAIHNCDFALYGGEVTLTYLSDWGYGTDKNVDFNGGKLTATSGANGIGGNTTINATSGWIKASKYGGSVTIAEGKYMKDETGRCYKGTLTDAEKAAVAGKTLQPATQTEYISYIFGGGNGSQNSPYLIGSTDSWNYFCDALQDNNTWNHFSGKYVKLGANISIMQSAGSAGHEFMGTFDGDGKTLTVNITETTTQGTAPFREIKGATIQNLVVTGSVAGTTHAAGLVGYARGDNANTVNTITNCKVATNVTVTTPGGNNNNNYHCGGVVGHAFHCTLNMSNTVYCGDITNSGNYVGGLQGWSDGNTINFSHCLFVGSYSGTASFHPVAVRNNNNATTANVSHVYYTVTPTLTNSSFIAADGTKTISRATVPATIGDPTQSLNFMNTTLYQYGICYNDLYYATIGLPSGGTDIYLIDNADDWLYFCEMLNDNDTWNRFSGKTVKLGANISVTQSAGSPSHDFCGTFDGQNYTLTFTATANANYLAPFRYVSGTSETNHAVIQNLDVVTNITATDFRHAAGLIADMSSYVDVTNCNVTANITATKGQQTNLYPAGLVSQVAGSSQLTVSGCTVSGAISTDGKYAAGMVGIVQGSANITNSVSSVTINSSTDGDGTHGGFIGGSASGISTNITGCAFIGSLLGTSTNRCAGFMGYNSGTLTISNSLFAPASVTVSDDNSATFARYSDGHAATITNCYYTTDFNDGVHFIGQGKQARSITAGDYVTVENAGTATTYSTSGITSYGTGILYDNVLYAGNGDAVSLTLTHQDPPEGYTFNGYIPSAGTLNGTTLTMPDEDVTISAPWTPISYAITYNLEGGNLPTGQSNPQSYTIESNDIELVNPIKSGYNFVGWTGTGLNGPTQTVIIAHGSMGIREYTAIWSVSVNYINENGVEQTVTALPLTGSETILDPGWYVVENTNPNGVDLAYTEGLSCSNGDLNLILCDGAEMTVTGAYTYDAISLDGAYTLTIYGQSQQSGKLTLTGSEYGKCIHSNNGSIVMNGGIVNATADTDGAIDCYSFTMNGGSFSATSNYLDSYYYQDGYAIQIVNKSSEDYGNFTFNGGNFSAFSAYANGIEGYYPTFTLSWTNTSDSFYVSSLGQVSINIAEGKDFIDDENNIHTSDEPGDIAGKTLRPFYYSPKNLTVTGITLSSAMLTWEAGNNETQWQVSWSTDGGSTWSDPVTVNNEPQYEITNLNPETTVQVQVKSIYSEGQSFPTSITFTTHSACDAPESLTATPIASSATLNWTGYQDSYNVRYCTVTFGDADTATEDFEHSGSMPEGWTKLDLGDGANTAELGISNDAAQNGTYGFRFSSFNGTNEGSFDQYLISPELNNLSALSFYYRASSSSSSGETFRVGYSTTTNDVSAFTWVSNGSTSLTDFSEFVEDASNIPANAKYFAINYTAVYQYRLYIDNITYTYTPLIVGAWNETNTNVTSPLTISGLTPETPYAWQVQGLDCDGNGGTTEWSAATFTTLSSCEVAPSELTATDITATTATLNWNGFQESYSVRYLPAILYEGFESGTMPDGWTRTGAYGSYWEVTSGTGFYDHTGAATGNYNAGCYFSTYGGSGILITPVMDLGNVASAALSFNFWNTDWDGEISILKVYYRVDEGEWHLLNTYGNATDRWIPVTIILEGLAANYQIGFECESHDSYGMGIDDVKVTGINTSEWTTVTNVSSPHNLTGLTPETQYLWQVQGLDCDGEGSTTEWSEMGIFTTPLHDPVAYIDANGQTQQCTDYTPLTGTETTLTAGWYVADGTLDYDHTITLSGDIHLILKDNAVMNVTSTEGYGFYYYSSSIPPSISIYAQSTGESKGQLHVDASVHGLYTRNDITINGGWVEATSNQSYGIFASSGNVIINGGIVEATGGVYGIFGGGNSVEIHGGEVTAIGPSYGINAQPGSVVISGGKVTATATNGTGIHARYSITISGGQVTANGRYDGIYTYDGIILGWTNASDFIYASSFYINNSNNYITLSKAFKDVDGNTYESGPVNASAINGKTLYPSVASLFTKTVTGYGTGNGGWVFIASPVAGSIAPSEVHNLFPSAGETSNEYDLYRFDQRDANGNEWQNWKATTEQNHPDFTGLVNGQGYLYATKETRTLVFAGEYTAATEPVEVPLDYDATAQLKGWNLVGNPFAVGATLSQPYYRMNEGGTALSAQVEAGNTVEAMEGVFVQATGNNQTVSFTAQTRGGEKRAVAALYIQVGPSTGSGTSVLDNAIIRFDGGQTLEKFSFREGSTKIYIPQDGKDYAIATSNGQGEIPVNFKAKENGTYTISVNPEGVEMNYLHLIDNMTGTDVDLLFTQNVIAGEDPQSPAPSYTFTAKTTDYESRFRLVFVANGEDGSATGSEAFAFFSNGNWIIANDGQATLQVIDINGRILSSESISGSVSKAIDATAGVYMIRLIDGENVRTQKIVVR